MRPDGLVQLVFRRWFIILSMKVHFTEHVSSRAHSLFSVCQATLIVIKNVVQEILASSQKNRLLEEARLGASGQEAFHGPSPLQGEAELAYLTHEGLFISDALNEAQQPQQAVVLDQSSGAGSRVQQSRAEAAGSNSGTTESSFCREQGFT